MTFQEIINYIQTNLNTTLTLEKLAALASLSPRHFSRQFKLYTQMSPNQYIIRCRVETAELLLLHTDIPIVDIAILVGFHSQSHLNRHFKRILKVTPQALRRNKREAPKKKKVVDKDSWKWLTNCIWIFLPRSIVEYRKNIKNQSANITPKKHDLNLYQQIQWNGKNNQSKFVSDIALALMLNYFVYVAYHSKNNEQKLTFKEFACGNLMRVKSIVAKQINYHQFTKKSKNIELVQNVQDLPLGVFLRYEHSSISAKLFKFKEPISMKFNRIAKVKNAPLSNFKNQLQTNEINPSIIKEGFQDKLSEGKLPPSVIKEGFQGKLSEGKFPPAVIREEFQDKISEGKLFDSFTGEGFRKPFQSFSGIEFERPFAPVSDEGFLPRVGIYEPQLNNDVDIDIFNKVIDSDLIEFGISELPRIPYGVASRIESLNDIEPGDFSFGDRPPFFGNFMGDEIANLTETE